MNMAVIGLYIATPIPWTWPGWWNHAVNSLSKVNHDVFRVWGSWPYCIFSCLIFCFFDSWWSKFGSGTPPSGSRTTSSIGFRPSFIQFGPVFEKSTNFWYENWGFWPYDFYVHRTEGLDLRPLTLGWKSTVFYWQSGRGNQDDRAQKWVQEESEIWS